MGRLARYIPENENGVLVEVTCRAHGGRALLSPGPNPFKANELIAGVLGRALEVSPLELCSVVFVFNHWHALAVVHDQQTLSRFMAHVGCNLSKEIGRLRGWRGTMWERRYDAIVVSDEPQAQWARLKYSLAHGVKEGLVERVTDWPGIHAARHLVHGDSLEGAWFNRSKEWAARNRGQEYGVYDYATRYAISFAQLPAFRDLSPEEYQDHIACLITEIEDDGEKRRAGNSVAGVERVLAQNPLEPPTRITHRSPKPLFHAASKEARSDLFSGFLAFQAQHRIAGEALRDGNPEAVGWFPEGSYPSTLPFVGSPAPKHPLWPPTREIRKINSGVIERGDIPVVEIPSSMDPKARPAALMALGFVSIWGRSARSVRTG